MVAAIFEFAHSICLENSHAVLFCSRVLIIRVYLFNGSVPIVDLYDGLACDLSITSSDCYLARCYCYIYSTVHDIV